MLMDVVAWLASPLVTLHPTFTALRVRILTAQRYFDVGKAKSRLGYLPLVGMEEALQRTAAWWAAAGYAAAPTAGPGGAGMTRADKLAKQA